MYCIKCGVQLADTEKKCPLCDTVVCHPDFENTAERTLYPGKKLPKNPPRSKALNGAGIILFLIPLFVSSFRRADELATAMECRCYRGGKGRTKMTVPHLHVRDFAALLLMVAFGTGLVMLNRYGFGYTV